jgi:hypothetical protein
MSCLLFDSNANHSSGEMQRHSRTLQSKALRFIERSSQLYVLLSDVQWRVSLMRKEMSCHLLN